MAVYAAHLTRTLQGTPSIFQVAAQEALGETVKPAIRKLIEYIASLNPNKYGWCEQWYDELYLIFDCIIQYHYLKHYAASFSECFYGLMRVPLSPSEEFNLGSRLPDHLEKGSLVFLVLMPYLKDKIEKIIDRWSEDYEDGRLGKSASDRCRAAAVRARGAATLAWHLARAAALARYAAGGARAPTPALLALRLALAPAAPRPPPADTWTTSFTNLLRGNFAGAVVTFPMVWASVSWALQWGAFAVQLLRWLDARPALAPALPAPPPPARDEKSVRYINKCPLCLQRWKVPTVLPVSGYVFCYACVSRHVRGAGACPVTALPAAARSLVRLYTDC